MNKKPFNVMSKVALAGIIGAAGITPAAVASAQEAQVSVDDVVITKDGQNIQFDLQEYNAIQLDQPEYLENATASFVVSSTGNKYSLQEYNAAKAELGEESSSAEAIQLLENSEVEPTQVNTVEGSIEDGEIIVGSDLNVESVSAINKTTVDVTFSEAVESVSAENFTIDGASVNSATLNEDKTVATLDVSGLDYETEYNVTISDILVNGETVETVTDSFTTPAVADIWDLEISVNKESLVANGADNARVTFQLVNQNTGEVDENADDVVLDLNTTRGSLAQDRVTIQDGQATVQLTSEFYNTEVEAKIDAQIIEASGDYEDLIGEVVGSTTVPFIPFEADPEIDIKAEGGESNQADRFTLYFDNEVALNNLVETNPDGELLYQRLDEGGGVAESNLTADEVEGLDAEDVRHQLIDDAITITQGEKDFTVKGLKPVSGNTQAMEVILEKTDGNDVLTDNASVNVDINTRNAAGEVTSSDTSFTVTDARAPEATGVNAEGMNTLKVQFSEAIDNASFQIDGQFGEVGEHFTVDFGDFHPATLIDNRDLATLVLQDGYDEDGDGDDARPGFFTPGEHSLQVSSTEDFAARTDNNNVGTTQNFNFTINADDSKPNAVVNVESPEQFRVSFDKQVSGFELEDMELQVYDNDAGEYVNVLDSEKFPGLTSNDLSALLAIDPVNNSEQVVELLIDWTVLYDTAENNTNYYNDDFRIVINEDSVTNVVNGETNEEIVLDLNYPGSPLNTPDTTSATIESIERVDDENNFHVTMSEPVKLAGEDAEDTPNQDQGGTNEGASVPTTSVQFIGQDEDGNTVTIDGEVNGYADEDGADKVLSVSWDEEAERTPQSIVNAGGSEDWTLVVRSLSDDVGNTVASATQDFTIEAVEEASPFYIGETAGEDEGEVTGAINGEGEDTVTITFSEGVQTSGDNDATDPGQYTLNGANLPTGTSISVDDRDGNSDNGNETVIITLPDGTLQESSNVITVNQDLESYDGSVLEGEYEVDFVVEDAVEDDEPEEPVEVVELGADSLGTAGDQQITGLEANTTYDVSVDGEPAVEMTTDAAGNLTGLTNGSTYVVTEVAPTEVELGADSLGTAGDQQITGLEANTTYNVSVDGEPAVEMTTDAAGNLTGLTFFLWINLRCNFYLKN
ncbi:hypothetical protein [Alteribacillus iranensis]|uniref:SbsA Ig-like domain-containing protein n=1 Tax=Alteribacillus iranensis TaxID=930128 RepID=A0A1I2BW85_9BACI|nr:hypothetical protein [Alteribacillus iranensis]SFE60265.1 hypothetical protein SAMN05192532_102539 [Alteribacillus iranensis]